MAYTPTNWTNGSGNALNQTNLNKIETGIDDAHDLVATLETETDADFELLKKTIALGGLIY